MSRTTHSRYAVHYTLAGDKGMTPSAWNVRGRRGRQGDGMPTPANLTAHVVELEASTRPGGVNAHLGPIAVRAARIVDQMNGRTVATFENPAARDYTQTAARLLDPQTVEDVLARSKFVADDSFELAIGDLADAIRIMSAPGIPTVAEAHERAAARAALYGQALGRLARDSRPDLFEPAPGALNLTEENYGELLANYD